MKGFVKVLIVFVFGIVSCDAALAQSKKELEAKKAKIQKEIEQRIINYNRFLKIKMQRKSKLLP